MSVTVGTLTIDLKANTASFTSEMSKASNLSARTANDIKRSLEKIAAVGLAMGTAVATGTVALIKSSIDQADALGKLAQSAGTTAETLSVLSYAAKLSGVQTDQLGVGLVRLSKAAFQAQNGNVQLERIFGRMGVTVTDSNGKLKDSGTLMEQLAVKFAGAADGAGKTAMATALFGKSGAALIPFLNQYGATQARVNAEAQRFGMVLSTNTVQLAGQAKEKMAALKEEFEGLGFAILSTTLPGLIKLSDKILEVADRANLPDLARAFGEKVSSAVTILGNTLEFAEKHAEGLKISLEALAGLKIAAIAIPVIGDLQKGGIANVGKGLDRLTVSFLGLEKTLPVLAKFGSWVKETSQIVALLITEDGLLSAANDVLAASYLAIGGPVGLAIGAIAGLGAALFAFRNSTFTLEGQTYELRDIWNAAWTTMKNVVTALGDAFKDLFAGMKEVWSGLTSWLSFTWIGDAFKSTFGEAISWAKNELGKLTPQPLIDALNQARQKRESVIDPRFLRTMPEPPPPSTHKPPFDTSGLGTPKKDIYGDEIRQLDQAIAAQRAYLAVLDAEPGKMQEAEAAEKARAEILKLNNSLVDASRPKLTALQEATISQKVATEESLKALQDYGKELVDQQRSADRDIQQSRAMAAANLEGDAAVRAATVDNAILGLTYNRTAEQLAKMAPELAKVRAELTAKSAADITEGADKEIYGLEQELSIRRLLTAATLDSIDAQRQADLAVKLYALDQQIATTADASAREALEAKRQAMVNLAQAESAQTDAQAARALLSPAEDYDREIDSLVHAVTALTALQGGTLTYGETLQIAAKEQDEFNKATDQTIDLLLREGSLGDGITAFFLKMQEQAKTTAATIYDVLNQTFTKLSDTLTDLITAPNHWSRQKVEGQFGTMFEDVGKNLLDSTIKQQMQGGLGKLGQAFGINLGSAAGKVDGSTSSNALWVRWATANGTPVTGAGKETAMAAPSFFQASNELDDLLGPASGSAPSGAASASTGGAAAQDIGGVLTKLGGVAKREPGPLGALGSALSAAGSVLGFKRAGSPPPVSIGAAQQPGRPGQPGSNDPMGQILYKLFGWKPTAKQTGPLSGETLGFPSSFVPSTGNELNDLSGATPAAANLPTALQNAAPALTSIPALLSASPSTVSGTSSGYDSGTIIPPSPLFPAASTNPLQTGPAVADSSGTPIASAPDVQAKTITQSQPVPPSTLDKVLAAGVQIAGIAAGAAAKTALTGGSGQYGFSNMGDNGSAGTEDDSSMPSAPGDSDSDGTVFAAGGGRVFGAGSGTSDSIPARLSHGEYVVNAASTAKHLQTLHAINNGTLRFAMGGFVGYDDGGLVSPSMAYLPAGGVSGMPTAVGSQIASNASSGRAQAGDTHHWTVQIPPGNPDPAQMTAHMDRYMKTAAPRIAALSIGAMREQQKRRPATANFTR